MFNLSSYTACLFDVDKTLSADGYSIPSRTIAALQKLHLAGIDIGVSTGRSFANLQTILSVFPKDALHIVSGGAEMITTAGDVVWHHYIESGVLGELYDRADAEHCPLITAVSGTFYGNKYSSQLRFPDVHAIDDIRGQEMPIVVVYQPTDVFLSWLSAQSSLSGKKMTNGRGVPYVDITPNGVNKGTTFPIWCKLQGKKPSEVIAIGDSENDHELFKAAGFAIAMGNASKETKAVADLVIGPCDEEGIASWIETVLAT